MVRKPEIHRTTLTAGSLGRVASARTEGHALLSLCLDLDPARFTHLRDRYSASVRH